MFIFQTIAHLYIAVTRFGSVRFDTQRKESLIVFYKLEASLNRSQEVLFIYY